MTEDIVAVGKKQSLRPGALVLVSFPVDEQTNNPARKFDGERYVIKTRHQPHSTWKPQFTLYDCETKKGKPYWFTEDELIPL